LIYHSISYRDNVPDLLTYQVVTVKQ